MDKKIILVAIAKEEEQYLREWVDYHLNLGFDEIIIYDNNQLNDDSQKSLIESYSSKVIYKDFRGKYDCCQQSLAYTDAWINNECDWIVFLDIDEFLDLCGKTIHDFVNQDKFENYEAIRLPWILYTDNDLIQNDGRPVLDRFTQFVYDIPEIKNSKSIYRHTQKSKAWVNSHKSAHRLAIFENICDFQGIELTQEHCIVENITQPHVKHFMFKTAEEAHDKIFKGDVLFGSKPRLNMIKKFFLINQYSKEKLNILLNGKNIQ